MTVQGGLVRRTIGELSGAGGVVTDGDWIETKDQDPNGDVRLIQLADIGAGRFLNKSSRYLTFESAMRLNCTFLEPGDVLIARMPDPIGRACIFPNIGQPAVTAVDVCVWRPGRDGADSRWIMHALNAPSVRDQFEMMASGTTRRRISGKQIKSFGLVAPSPARQREIARRIDEAIDDIDIARDDLARVKALCRRYRDQVLHAECSGLIEVGIDAESVEHLNLPPFKPNVRFEGLPDLPRGWKWTEMKALGRVTGGLTKNQKRDALPRRMRYISVSNVYADELRLSNVGDIGVTEAERQRVLLMPGDLLVVEGNGSIGQIGRVAQWDGSIAECGHQNHLIRIRPHNGVPGRYLLHWMMSPFGREALESVASSSAGLHTLSISKVESIPVAMPPPAVAEALAQRADHARSTVDTIMVDAVRSIALLERLREATIETAIVDLGGAPDSVPVQISERTVA